MQTKPLLYGIIGFMMGGLIVSVAAVTIEKPTAVTASMTNSLKGKTGDNFDKAYIDGMIAHHQDAINMSKLSEASAKHQEVKDLSKAIRAAQQQEIDTMKAWQTKWGYSASSLNHESMSH